jgi:predicted AlkP superfamily pyrophosphatase or phosphodiesterase
MKIKKNLTIIIILSLLIICVGIYFSYKNQNSKPKQLIFIGVDGMQVAYYNELLNQGKLTNFNKLMTGGGESSSAEITRHTETVTSPGNAELHTGLSGAVTGIVDNSCGKVIPPGETTFERLAGFDPKINLGLVYGKGTCYLPGILANAKSVISWWQDRTTYPQKKYVTSACADSLEVANKALEFIKMYKGQSFYLFVYFGAPDCAGHTFGLPSVGYTQAIQNVDGGLGVLLDGLKSISINPKILLSGDHGWNTNTKGHDIADSDTKNVVLVTNDHNLIDSGKEQAKKKQCDIAPTILDYFEVPKEQYSDILQLGCNSLIKTY